MVRFGFISPMLALAVVAAPSGAVAQSLHGSPSSVDRMHGYAEKHDLYFYQTGNGIRRAAERGRFVRLSANRDFTLHNVDYPYVRPVTRTFVRRLARQYHAACGERLVVTSAARPITEQPANSSPESVHPTGIAIDLRRPTGKCLRWLRKTLLILEKRKVIEATEERHPAHFHVAVFGERYRVYRGLDRRGRYIASNRSHGGAASAGGR